MVLSTAIIIVNAAASVATVGLAFIEFSNWLLNKTDNNNELIEGNDELREIIIDLPDNATPDEIMVACKVLYRDSVGGDVNLSAAHNGGGDLNIYGDVEGGKGAKKGGDVNIKAGDGGPDGKGGDVNIGPGSSIKGGDAG